LLPLALHPVNPFNPVQGFVFFGCGFAAQSLSVSSGRRFGTPCCRWLFILLILLILSKALSFLVVALPLKVYPCPAGGDLAPHVAAGFSSC